MSVRQAVDGADRLSALLADGGARARATRRPVLVSIVEQVPAADPLEALSAKGSHETDRMYWARPVDDFALAGLGAVVLLTPCGTGRFASVDRVWAALMADALIDDPSGGAPGAGPVLMGGFAFDPDGPRTQRWRDFPAARLTVPRMQLAVSNGACWLTTNVLVASDGEPDIQPAELARLRTRFPDRSAHASEETPGESGTERDDATLTYADARSAADWRATVRDAVRTIRAGHLEKVVLAREVLATAPRDLDIVDTLRQLRAAHPTCYVFGCWHGDSAFIGATPERLVRLEGRDVQASSLAGSVSRGGTPEEDAAQTALLFASEKDRAEHEIVRRALCAGLAEVCDDVTAASEPSLLTLPQVHHLHTAVRARLREGHSLLQLVARLHPTPAVGGAPRGAALGFIHEHERMDRGWYAAPVGWLQRDRGEFAVALRSALVTGAHASLFAGCGVVADSDPDQEYAESLLKLRPMEAALTAALAPLAPSASDDGSDCVAAACGESA